MNIEPSVPTTKHPPAQFAGDVWLDPIALPHEGDQRMVVATVRFAPGARTAWHSHARGQYLRVTQGIARFGGRDGTIIEVHPGQTLYTPPGEEHWHASSTRGGGGRRTAQDEPVAWVGDHVGAVEVTDHHEVGGAKRAAVDGNNDEQDRVAAADLYQAGISDACL